MSRLFSPFNRAALNLRQNWVISLITVAIISVCLFLVGGYILLTSNLQGIVERWRSDIRVTVYLRDGFPEADAVALQDRLSGMAELESVTYVSKGQAMTEFKAMLGTDARILEGMTENPLPASLRLSPRPEFRNADGILAIVSRIGDPAIVQEVQYGQDWLERIEKLLGFLAFGAVILGTILSLAAVFIISNTIKITVMARRDELEIMRLVGATEIFIRTPFFIEGIIQGLAGSLVALALLSAAHRLVVARISPILLATLGVPSLQFLDTVQMAALLAGGMMLGGLGSLASVGKFSRR